MNFRTLVRVVPCLAAVAALSGLPAQIYVEVPSNANPYVASTNVIPFGTLLGSSATCMIRFPASDLDLANRVIRDVAFQPAANGTWSANNVRVAFGHIPNPIPCPFSFPTQGGANLGSFLDLTTVWVGSQHGPLSWTAAANQWSRLNLPASGAAPFVWNGVDDVGFYFTFQNVQLGGGWNGGCLNLGAQGPRRCFAGGFQAAVTPAAGYCNQLGGLWTRVEVGCTTPAWQTNQPVASLSLGGGTNNSCGPIVARPCDGVPTLLTMSSIALGRPWDLLVTSPAPVPAGGGGLATPGGQFLNIDLFSPATLFLNGGAFNNQFAPVSVPVAFAAPLSLGAQMAVRNLTHPDGFTLSAAVAMEVRQSFPVSLPVMDDGDIQINLGVPPFCGPSSINFYGVGYTSFFANCNGFVSFGSGTPDWFASPTTFASDMPRIAGCWTDFTLVGGNGSVTAAAQGQTVTVSYQNVPEWQPFGPPGPASSFDITFDAASGACAITGYNVHPNHGTDSLTGITPGGGVPVGPQTSFFSFLNAGPQSGPPSGMIYEFVAGGAPGGFSTILFPNSDGSSFIVY